MTSLSEIVNVQITRQTQSVSQAGFGTLMVLGTHKRFNNRIRYYNNMSGVAVDFRSYDKEYIAAQDVFAQSPAPSRLAIGRRTANTAVLRVITAMTDKIYGVRINGNDVEIDSTPTAQQSTITFSGPFSNGNTIDLNVNGVPISQVTATGNPATINAIAAEIALEPGVQSADVNGNSINVIGLPNENAIVTGLSILIGSGSAPPTGTVFTAFQPVSNINIANALTTEINDAGLEVTADDSAGDGTFTISADVAGIPFTLDTYTDIADPNQAVVTVSQVEPNQTYTIQLNKRPFSYTAPNDVESATQIAAALIDLINLDPLFPVAADFDNVAQQTLVQLDADLVIGNEIDITLNGQTLPTVTFGVGDTHETVMIRITELLEDQPGIQSANLFGSTLRNIQMVGLPDNNAIISAFDVTLGASQATATLTDEVQPSGSIVLTNNDATKTFNVVVTPNIMTLQKGLLIQPLDPSDAVQDDLDAVQESSDDWYGLALTSRAVQDILSTATWTETRQKLFGTCSSQETIINLDANEDQVSIAYQLFTAGYTKTFLMYHQDADDDYPECAWFGKCLPLEPGSETWKFKQLATISYSNLSTNQSINAQSKSANTYQYVGGFGITAEGTVSNGEFIDVIRGVAWLTARIQEFVFFVLVNNNKVPYTDTGIAMIEAEVRRALDLGVSNNFLAEDPEYTVTVPRAASIPPNDKANRILRDVSFQATLAGAIHFVEIRGVVSV